MSFINITLKDILENDCSLSASMYQRNDFNYSFYKKLSEFILELQKGYEPGSKFYSENKDYKFIRTSNIEDSSFLFKDTFCVGIADKVFKYHNLKKEQILMVKDATLGKVAILDKDYPNYMLCGGIHSLTCEFPYYVFAILQHPLFKINFEKNIPRGSTFSHAGERYLDFDIPLPINNDKEVILFIENLMESAILKEILIKERFYEINKIISNELNFKDFKTVNNQEFPRINEISEKNKLYAGFHSKKSKFIKNLIKSYKGGYFFIEESKIKSGFTPSNNKKVGPLDDNSLKYMWIAPTNINEIGLINIISSIEFDYKKNNLHNNACLLINRTSKKVNGESGKFVGISTFYDYDTFREGQHNQGIYRIEGYDDIDLIMFVVLLNHPIYREFFGEISLGSKMKEIKIDDLISIPFPNFHNSLKEQISQLYYSRKNYNFENLNNRNFLQFDKQWCEEAGLYDLYTVLLKQKIYINSLIEQIYNGENVDIDYNFSI